MLAAGFKTPVPLEEFEIQLPHEALHGMITTGEPMIANQVLVDPLRRQTCLHRRFNDILQRPAQTLPTSNQTSGERNGRF